MQLYPSQKEVSSFGTGLVAFRKARGLTKVQLAEATGTTQRSISYFENADCVPPSSIMMVLAQALPVSPDELKPPPKAAPMLIGDGPEIQRLWKPFQVVTQLPEQNHRAVLRLIRPLAADAAPHRNAAQGEHNGR